MKKDGVTLKTNISIKQKLWLYLILFFVWMISVGSIPILLYFTDDKKDVNGLLKTIFIIAIVYCIMVVVGQLYVYIEKRIKQSEDVRDIRDKLSLVLKTKIAKRFIMISIIVFLLFIIGINFWGTTEIDKPFNKFYYEVIYEANLSKVSSLENIQRIEVWVKVSRTLFFKKKIELDYIYYNNKDIDFDDESVYLTVGKYIPVEFYLDGKDYKWYIEMTNKKVSDYKYFNGKN